jgi:hypothetical protein
MPSLTWWWMIDDGAYMIGPAADWTLTPGRDPMFRLGPSVIVNLGPHLALQMVLTLPVVRPDQLGYFNQIWGTVGVEWFFATGEPKLALF